MPKNNKIGAVSVQSEGRTREPFPLTHDVNTTFGWGETQPLCGQLCPPKSMSKVKVGSLVRLAPMPKPTFGNITLDVYHSFVNLTDLSRNFAELLAGTRVSRGDAGIRFVPQKVPKAALSWISSLVLYESHLTIWVADNWAGKSVVPYKLLNTSNSADSALVTKIRTFLTSSSNRWVNNGGGAARAFDTFKGIEVDFSKLLNQHFFHDDTASAPTTLNVNTHAFIPLLNPSTANDSRCHFLFDTRGVGGIRDWNYGGANVSPVMLNSADYVICRELEIESGTTYKLAFAFRLSDFGKRIRKILIGLGYQINFADNEYYSLMPLFAYFKAYFNSFGLLLYTNWEDTAAARILNLYDNSNYYEFGNAFYNVFSSADTFGGNVDVVKSLSSLWKEFIHDLGAMYVTAPNDWISSHTRNFAVATDAATARSAPIGNARIPDVGGALDLNITGVGNGELQLADDGTPLGAAVVNNHAYINNVIHGQLDSEVLKKMYYMTNNQTIAGKRVRELLKLQGLGDWMDSQTIRFIGKSSVNINISDVAATADTYNSASDEGEILGTWGANGLGADVSKSFKFENDEFGYYIVLAAIVPNSGFCQQVNPTLACIDKQSFYQPAYDGKGYEATMKDKVCGALDWVEIDSVYGDENVPNEIFGFSPRYSGLKIAPNVINGDFSLNSTKETYRPYFLDKVIDANSHDFAITTTGSGTSESTVINAALAFDYADIPIAGNPWRFDTRYPWLGNLTRIFANIGDPYINYQLNGVVGGQRMADFYEYFSNSTDNFMVHNTIVYSLEAPMLQIADSYETIDPEEGGTSERIGKA